MADGSSNSQPFFFGNTVTNIVAPVNTTITNVLNAFELDSEQLYWSVYYGNAAAQTSSSFNGILTNSILKSLTYNVTNPLGQIQFYVTPAANFTGQVAYQFVVSSSGYSLQPYYYQTYFFTFGDTPIGAQASATAPQRTGTFTNLLLATFTNGASASAATNFTASIQWGDDTITAGVINTNTSRMKLVLGSHTYTNSGVYPIAITIQSGLGVTAVVTNAITVVPSLSLMRMGSASMRW